MIILIRVDGSKATAASLAGDLKLRGFTVLHDVPDRGKRAADNDTITDLVIASGQAPCFVVQSLNRDRTPRYPNAQLDAIADLILRAEVLKVGP